MSRVTLLHHTPINPIIKATAMPYQSKENSKLIESLIPSSFKYHISEVKNYIET